ncbi:hypothetical protein B0H11DRAFT_1723087 [Mycena galericulata]|nr:hypothetical protein B0H11DRAFT_1723087 [Mycena galericulata]
MLAARLRVKVTQNDASFEYARHMVCKFSSGKIDELYDILDTDERQQRKRTIEPVPVVPSRLSDPPAVDLVQFYKDYLTCINGRTMKSDLHRFCQPQVTWGGRPHALDEYRMLMEDSFDAISGLRFNLRYIIVDAQKQQIAARLDFAGTPVKEYAGAQPTGRSVQFSEHAFYWLENGKIAAVLTVIDWDSYRRQLVGEHIVKSSESEKA